nr:flagellar filament capping protein FliD [Myxococcota bacterium]
MTEVGSSRLTFGGLATGVDTAAIVDALIDVQRQPLLRLQDDRRGIVRQQDLLRQLNTLVLDLREAARAIDNQSAFLTGPSLNEELLALTASSSDEGVLVASADDGAALSGSFDVTVGQVATGSRRISAAYASAADVVGQAGDTVSIAYGGAASIDFTLTAGTTLEQVRDAINLDANNDGSVRADLLDDGQGGVRLILSGTKTGSANDVSVTTTVLGPGGVPFLDADLSEDAQDAQLTVFGVAITRPGNEIADAIPGLTLQLKGDGDATVDLSRDDEAIASRLQTFVDAYNAILDFSDRQTQVDADTQRAGPLSGDFTMRTSVQTIQTIATDLYAFTDNPFQSLSQIGVGFDANGRLSLD